MDTNWGIIGHQNIVSYLENCLKKNKLVQTYLFYGIRHLGKTTVALKFTKLILNKSLGHHPDLFELKLQEGKKDISIDQVRDWQHWLTFKSFTNGYKVGIIRQAENLNEESSNALLKTIEEPTIRTILILISSASEQLLPTIISRSQKIHFLRVGTKEIASAISQRVDDSKKLKEILAFSLGRPGLAIKFCEDEEFFNNYLKLHEKVTNLFDTPLIKRFEFVEQYLTNKDYQENLEKVLNFLRHWEFILRERMILNLASEQTGQGRKKFIQPLDLLIKTKQILEDNVQPRLALENLLINL